MPEYVPEWGPDGGFDSNDYSLKMIDNTDGTVQDLVGHSLTSPNTNIRDALTIAYIERKNGRQVIVTKTKRPAEVTNYTYTVGYPKRALWTPLMHKARQTGGCEVDLARVYECPPDRQYNHWYAMNAVALGPVTDATDPITNTEERTIQEKQSEITVTEEVIGWALRTSTVHTVASKKINASAFYVDECAGCNSDVGLAGIIVGGDGTAVPTVQVTANRYASITAKSMGALTDVGKDVATIGNTVITALYTGATFAAATAGKLFVSNDRLATSAVAVTGFIDVISRLVVVGNTVFAVGKDLAGEAVVHVSLNRGSSWTAVTSTALPAVALLDAAWDKAARKLYVVGEDGKVLVGEMSGSTMLFTDISANVNEASTDFAAVVVLDYNHIFIGGSGGKAKESRDGGATWSTVVVAGTTAITAADGDKNRLVVGAGTNVYLRDVLTSNNFSAITMEFGQTLAGIVASVRMAPENFNLFTITTANGEVAIMKPFYPGA
jgi:hypothetical protein